MSHELYPALFSKFDFTAENKKIVSAKANRIIAISENTKKDIISLLHVPASKIDVIPLATTLAASMMKKSDRPVPETYVLYVGKRNTYKNFSFLLEAMDIVLRTYPACSLLCAGGGKFTALEQAEIERLRLTNKILQMDVDDSALAYLYAHARAFIFPSLYEGFGIPTLEAFACGCPVLLSNRSSLPEVGGDAAGYFDPENVSSLAEKILEVLEDPSLANTMRERGMNRVKFFSWEQTARKTLDTYMKVVL
jgi:glycosyltransferase involved in cell wall biosynthesis